MLEHRLLIGWPKCDLTVRGFRASITRRVLNASDAMDNDKVTAILRINQAWYELAYCF